MPLLTAQLPARRLMHTHHACLAHCFSLCHWQAAALHAAALQWGSHARCVGQVNLRNLKDRERWASGWLQKSEVEALNDLGGICQVCAGTGHMTCPLCKDESVVII